MGNEILTITENDSLSMRCLHLRREVYGAVAARSFRGMIERSLRCVGLIHAVVSMCGYDQELPESVILGFVNARKPDRFRRSSRAALPTHLARRGSRAGGGGGGGGLGGRGGGGFGLVDNM